MLEMWHHDGDTPWPEVSDAALMVWLGARDRERRGAVYAATRSERLITIDGTPAHRPPAGLAKTVGLPRWTGRRFQVERPL